MTLVRITVAGIDEKGNLIAQKKYQGKDIYVNGVQEGETVVTELIDRGEYVFAEVVDEYDTDDIITLSESHNRGSSQSAVRSRTSNQEPVARCPVDGCFEERLTRGMALHVYNSVGGGHGEHGVIPSGIRFDSLEIVGSSSVEVDSGIESSSGKVRIKCPSCKLSLPEERSFMNHFEELVSTGDRSEETDVRVPTVWIDDRGAVYRIVDEFSALSEDLYIERNLREDDEPEPDVRITDTTGWMSPLGVDEYIVESTDWHNRIENMIEQRPELTEQSVERDATERRHRDKAFADLVKRAYDYSCAVCGRSRRGPNGQPEVEAAHIYPKSQQGSDDIRNGLSLCRLHHWAFDSGWFSITTDLRIDINGNPAKGGFAELNQYQDMPIRTPSRSGSEPHQLYIEARISDLS